MLLKLFQYLRGYLRIRVSGYSTERFLNACSQRGIRIWEVHPVHNAYEMNISIQGFKDLKPVIKRTGAKVVIVKKRGFPFFLNRYRKRKLFLAGTGVCIFLIFLLSRFIWNIDLSGNLTHTDEMLLRFLESKGVRDGMRVSQVDCERIVKDIRKEYDDVIWVSASIEGTKLIIQIKENEDSIDTEEEDEDEEIRQEEQAMDIVADTDCVITGIVMRKGIVQVEEGSQVTKGTVLVSGQVPVKNDAGETVAYQKQVSDADIRGQVTLTYKDSQGLTYDRKEYEQIEKYEYYIRIGTYRFAFGGIKNEYEDFELYSKETPVRIFGNFYLPVVIGVRRAIPYTPVEVKYKKKELQELLSERFQRYCDDLEKKGVEIIQNDVKIYTGLKEAEAKGTLTVNMPVGEKQPSRIIELPENAGETNKAGEETNGNNGSSH